MDPADDSGFDGATIDVIVTGEDPGDETVERFRRLLTGPRTPLARGTEYTGRPTTWIFSDGDYVAKVRREFTFAARDARRWIRGTLKRQRQLGVYPPGKVWAVVETSDAALIANLCQRMQPLHRLDPADIEPHLGTLLELYLEVASKHNRRLDEGLSNFGVAPDGALYYLDDDVYDWDEFTSLAEAVGYWCRALDWFTPEVSQRVGGVLARLLNDAFGDTHPIAVVAHLIRQASSLNAKQKRRRTAFLKGLEVSVPRQRRVRGLSGKKPFALLADVHANLPALQAVIKDMDELHVDHALVLGDVVGYGPHPKQCVEELRGSRFTVIKGNHDHAIATGRFRKGYSQYARTVADWTREQLTSDEMKWLERLPPTLTQDGWLAVHGAPQDKQFFYGYVYRMTFESNLDAMMERGINLCFHGHSHVSGVYYRTKHGIDDYSNALEQSVEAFPHCLICPGSVGQPRENDGTAARYAVFGLEDKDLTFRKVDYDLAATIADMEAFEFPERLAHRLQGGN